MVDVAKQCAATEIAEWTEAYKAGATLLELAAKDNLPYQTIRRSLLKAGVAMRAPGRRPMRLKSRICKMCHRELPISQFYRGLCTCKRCYNRDRVHRPSRFAADLARFGMTLDDLQQLMSSKVVDVQSVVRVMADCARAGQGVLPSITITIRAESEACCVPAVTLCRHRLSPSQTGGVGL